ncbi:hypothetical protein C5167_017170 [Papaver somniferum]|uniref:Uncharacterized protein n=1 Tax=Papaver somniferum TaxID=3469 RepID=A0A4Y7ILZ4_PAPSO|nr:hypothetical protein C5167_017170 [Papaver somniferum]
MFVPLHIKGKNPSSPSSFFFLFFSSSLTLLQRC